MGFQHRLNRHHRLDRRQGGRQARSAMDARMVATYTRRQNPTLALECPVCSHVCLVDGLRWPTVGQAIDALAEHWQAEHPEQVGT